MLKKELKGHLTIYLLWTLAIIFFHLNFRVSILPQIINVLFLIVGGVFGTLIFDFDHVIYVLFIHPQELTSMRAKRFLEQRKIKEMLVFLGDTYYERKKMIFHSVLFQVLLIPFAAFVCTSTISPLGIGFVMGLYLHSLVDQALILLGGGKLDYWFWQFKTEITYNIQRAYFGVMVAFFILLSLILNW